MIPVFPGRATCAMAGSSNKQVGRWRGSISCNACKPNAAHTIVSNNGGQTQRLGHTQPCVTRAHGLDRHRGWGGNTVHRRGIRRRGGLIVREHATGAKAQLAPESHPVSRSALRDDGKQHRPHAAGGVLQHSLSSFVIGCTRVRLRPHMQAPYMLPILVSIKAEIGESGTEKSYSRHRRP